MKIVGMMGIWQSGLANHKAEIIADKMRSTIGIRCVGLILTGQ